LNQVFPALDGWLVLARSISFKDYSTIILIYTEPTWEANFSAPLKLLNWNILEFGGCLRHVVPQAATPLI
jgi:hypothetical protein